MYLNSNTFPHTLHSSLPRCLSHLVAQLDSRAVEDGLLGIVDEAVLYHELEVTGELVHVAVLVRLGLLPHGGEVHGVLHHVKVIMDLVMGGREGREDSHAVFCYC